MKDIFKNVKEIFYTLADILITVIYSAIMPICDTLTEILKPFYEILDINFKFVNKIATNITKNLKRTMRISLFLYNLILLILEFYMLMKVLQGEIIYYKFSDLFFYTLITFIFSAIFVLFLNKNYKSKKFSYFIYFQILFLLPLILVYWIANIEGHTLYLKDLDSNQWISLFNTIIIYFSGCFIGLITLYRTKEVNNDKKQ